MIFVPSSLKSPAKKNTPLIIILTYVKQPMILPRVQRGRRDLHQPLAVVDPRHRVQDQVHLHHGRPHTPRFRIHAEGRDEGVVVGGEGEVALLLGQFAPPGRGGRGQMDQAHDDEDGEAERAGTHSPDDVCLQDRKVDIPRSYLSMIQFFLRLGKEKSDFL